MMTFPSVDMLLVEVVLNADVSLHGMWYEDAPNDACPPYCTFQPEVTRTPALRGDTKVLRWATQAQVDWWGDKNSNDQDVTVIRDALHGYRAVVGGNRVRVNVENVSQAEDDYSSNLVHYTITLEVQ